ncbi:hypothetical protein RB195_011954 [Necator americanus]|uniref:Uncharacterized protein n=1 Tax=Necator americanus TaxID=51031 RepID=A0ABR1D4W1_NECAM
MQKQENVGDSKVIVVDVDGMPVSQNDDAQFMMMPDAILPDDVSLKKKSKIVATDDLRGHSVTPTNKGKVEDTPKTANLDTTNRSIASESTVKPESITCQSTKTQRDYVNAESAKGPPTQDSKNKTCGRSSGSQGKTSENVKNKQSSKDEKKGGEMEAEKTKSDSIKTALDISTIPREEARKYSFLHKDGVSVYDDGELSNIDLYATTQTQLKGANSAPDMKKLEAYFAVPPQPLLNTAQSAEEMTEKSGKVEVRKRTTKTPNVAVAFRQRMSKKIKERRARSKKRDTSAEDKTSTNMKKKNRKETTGVATNFLQKLLRRKDSMNVMSVNEKKDKSIKSTRQT